MKQDYEELQVKLESKDSELSGKYHKMNRFLKDAIEKSDRVLSKEQIRRHQRKGVSYNKRHTFEETEVHGVYP